MVKVLTKLLLTLTVILFANQSFAEKIPTLTLKEIQDLEGQSDTETIEGFTLKDLEEPRSFSLNDILKTRVEIRDYLGNGCWTNLGEVKAYAEDKLRLKGVEVGNLPFTDAKYGLYEFIIEGFGIRMQPSRVCVAHIKLEISSFTLIYETIHRAVAYSEVFLRLSQRDSNLNNDILEIVRRTIEGLE